MKRDALYWFAMLPLIPIAFGAPIALFLAIGILLYRVYYFLKYAHWLSSMCDATTAMIWGGLNVPDACHQFSFGWLGVNYLLHAGLRDTDATLFAMTTLACSVCLALLWIFSLAAVVREFDKR